jgi:hypothetical protein
MGQMIADTATRETRDLRVGYFERMWRVSLVLAGLNFGQFRDVRLCLTYANRLPLHKEMPTAVRITYCTTLPGGDRVAIFVCFVHLS